MERSGWPDTLAQIDKPEVSLPNHKMQLHRALRSELSRQPERKGWVSRNMVLRLVAAASLVLAVTAGSVFFIGTETMAYATLHVNPAFEFAIGRNNKVSEVEALNDDAKQVVADLKLTGHDLTGALKLVAEKTIALGLVSPNASFVFSLRPATNKSDEKKLAQLAKDAKESLGASLQVANLNNTVKSAVISKQMFESTQYSSALLEAYIDLVEANVTPAAVRETLALVGKGSTSEPVSEKELQTIVALLADMIDAGLGEAQSLAYLRRALYLGKNAKGVSTVISAMIDIHDAGGNPEHLLVVMEEALKNGLEHKSLVSELTTLASAYTDMVDAGITPNAAKGLLAQAMKTDPTLEEVTTVVAAVIDMVEEGMTEAEAITKIEDAIKADPSLETLEELLGAYDDAVTDIEENTEEDIDEEDPDNDEDDEEDSEDDTGSGGH